MTKLFMCPWMLETAKDRMESQEVISLTSSIITRIRDIDSESYNLVREAIRVLTGESMDGSAHVLSPLLAFLKETKRMGLGSKATALSPNNPEPSFLQCNMIPKCFLGSPNWVVDLVG